MRFLHLSDLHLGKKLRDFDLSKDHEHALDEALSLAVSEKLDAIVIAGDVYDTAAPSAQSMALLDRFLAKVEGSGIPLLMINGNHDSPEKLHYLSGLARRHGIYIETNLQGAFKPVTIAGVDFFLLPFVNYRVANDALGLETSSLEEAVKEIVGKMDLSSSRKKVLVAHQSVLPESGKLTGSGTETQPTMSGEDHAIGGSDVLPCSLFDAFDYVALGHIHKAMAVSPKIRYPGAILKFDRQEANYKKTFTIVDINENGVSIEERPFRPLHDVVILKGKLDDLLEGKDHHGDYAFFVLEDTVYQNEPMARLRGRYPLASGLEYPNIKTASGARRYEDVQKIDRAELFASFYKDITSSELTPFQKDLVKEMLAKSKEEE